MKFELTRASNNSCDEFIEFETLEGLMLFASIEPILIEMWNSFPEAFDDGTVGGITIVDDYLD